MGGQGLSCRTQASGDSWGLLSGSLSGQVSLGACWRLHLTPSWGLWPRAGSPGWAGLCGTGSTWSQRGSCWPVQLTHFSFCDNFIVALFGEFTERATRYVKLYKSEVAGTSTVVRLLLLSSAGTFLPLQRGGPTVTDIPSPGLPCICDFVIVKE